LALQSAPTHRAFAPRRFAAPDPRADGRRRLVRLDAETVAIARAVAGVAMNLTVPTRAYRGVALRLAGVAHEAFAYEIRLVHADPDLSVALAETDDLLDAQAEWRLWARALGLPTLVERDLGRDEPDRPMVGKVVANGPAPRRRGKTLTARRARFLTRRKLGRPELARPVGAVGELFAGWRPDR
jgi:hypothetical protein